MANFIDKAISFFDPKWGMRRAQHRNAIQALERSFEGARRDRRTAGWNAHEYTDNIQQREVATLRARSKDLFRNNPYANKGHKSIAHNVTGTGIMPAISNNKLKNVWKAWAEDIECDFDGNLDFYGLQNLVMKTISIQGECIVLRIRSEAGLRVPIELKVISAKLLDSSKDTPLVNAGNNYIEGGIEYNSKGKKVAYWILNSDHNNSFDFESTRWSAEEVIHLFEIDEPGQSRGIPFGSSSMMSLRDFDDYADAQLMRQKVAACFSVFVTESNDMGLVPQQVPERGEKVEPGIIEYLEPGKQVSFASPPPAEGYGEYSRNVLTGIASGFGMSYEAISGDLSNTNFSSGRMGWLDYNRFIESYQWFIIIPKLCKGVWKWFVDAAIIAGMLPKSTPMVVEWTAPKRQMIDPVKEINGLLAQVRSGFMSWQEAVRSLGYTPEEVLEEIKASAKLFDDAGVMPKCDPRYDSTKSSVDTAVND